MARTFWIARDRFTQSVHLFERKPSRDEEGIYLERTNHDEGMLLGKRPKLPFKLKSGTCRRVKILVEEV